MPTFFADRKECVFYDETDLEALLEHYLAYEDQRQEVADAALRRVEGYGFDALWRQALDRLGREWPAIEARSRSRPAFDALPGRVWRWNHPEKGILPPASFIQMADKSGLIDRITTPFKTRWAMRHV